MKKPLLSEMTLREKIGQCLCVRQYDLTQKTEVDELIPRPAEERDSILKETQPGVFWCHGKQNLRHFNMAEKNYGKHVPSSDEYIEWVRAVDKNLNIHGLMAADVEYSGPGSLFSDLTSVCGGITIGAANSPELTYELGKCIATELKSAGINWRWAPVVDISNRFSMDIMRPFSQNPDQLIELANAHIRGMQENGVAATAKHFPGADRNEYRDSHFTTAVLSSTMEEWWKEQGKVFQAVIDGGVYSVMMSHKAFPACDDTIVNGNYISSSLSKKIVTDLLKGKMGFKGVVITDGIGMAGVRSFYDYDKMLVEFINAGNDVILGANCSDVEIIEKAVLDGRISMERIDDACGRILDMKEKIGIFEDDYFKEYDIEKIKNATKSVDSEIAKKCITLIRDTSKLLPVDKNKIKNVMIVCSTHDDGFFDRLDCMKKEIEARGINVKMQRRLDSIQELGKISEENDLIIYAAYIAPHKPKGAMFFFEEECDTFGIAFSHGKDKSIAVSMGYPYIYYDFMGGCPTCINAYTDTENVMKAFVAAIFGEIPIEGKSPVSLEPPKFF